MVLSSGLLAIAGTLLTRHVRTGVSPYHLAVAVDVLLSEPPDDLSERDFGLQSLFSQFSHTRPSEYWKLAWFSRRAVSLRELALIGRFLMKWDVELLQGVDGSRAALTSLESSREVVTVLSSRKSESLVRESLEMTVP